MSTTTMAKIRTYLGMAPNAPLDDVNAELDHRTTANKEGADAGLPSRSERGATEATEEQSPAAEQSAAEESATLATQIVTLVGQEVSAAIEPLNATISSLTEANTALTARIAALEATETAEESGGEKEATETGADLPVYARNPINERIAARLSGK